MTKPYSELVTQAERAVASVKDAELRRVAFERVLNDLLSTEDETPKTKSRTTARVTKQVPQKSAGKKRGGPQSYVEEMIEDEFFKKPKTISEVKASWRTAATIFQLHLLAARCRSSVKRKCYGSRSQTARPFRTRIGRSKCIRLRQANVSLHPDVSKH